MYHMAFASRLSILNHHPHPDNQDHLEEFQ
jgi:hypothetical protein